MGYFLVFPGFIFAEVNISEREKKIRIFRTLTKDMKATKVSPLGYHHIKTFILDEETNKKTDFSTVICNDKCRSKCI